MDVEIVALLIFLAAIAFFVIKFIIELNVVRFVCYNCGYETSLKFCVKDMICPDCGRKVHTLNNPIVGYKFRHYIMNRHTEDAKKRSQPRSEEECKLATHQYCADYIQNVMGIKLNPNWKQIREDAYKMRVQLAEERYERSKRESYNRMMAEYYAEKDPNAPACPGVPRCPYCNSTNLSKIGIVNRSVSVGTLGLASSKIGKQWHCNSCGSNF